MKFSDRLININDDMLKFAAFDEITVQNNVDNAIPLIHQTMDKINTNLANALWAIRPVVPDASAIRQAYQRYYSGNPQPPTLTAAFRINSRSVDENDADLKAFARAVSQLDTELAACAALVN